MEQYNEEGRMVISSIPDPKKLEYGALSIASTGICGIHAHSTERTPATWGEPVESFGDEVRMQLTQIDLSSPGGDIINPEITRLQAEGLIEERGGYWYATEAGEERKQALYAELWPHLAS